MFVFRHGDAFMYLCTYVDDLFPLFNRPGKIFRDQVLAALKQKMTIDNKGKISWAFDTKIERDAARQI